VFALGYKPSTPGILETLSTPEGHAWLFTWDSAGRLVGDRAPNLATKTLTREPLASGDPGWSVLLTTPEGRTTRYETSFLSSGTTRTQATDISTPQLVTTRERAPSGVVTTKTPDLVETKTIWIADPRLGVDAPMATTTTTTTPGLRKLEVQHRR